MLIQRIRGLKGNMVGMMKDTCCFLRLSKVKRAKKSKDPGDFDGGSFLLASVVPIRMRFVGLKY